MTSIELLSNINDIDKRNEYANIYGMKATNEGILKKYGFDVPNGFVVTPEWKENVDGEALKNYYKALNATSVSVRSSATCEDSHKYSFAGIFESFMPIRLDELPLYIEKCRESLKSEEALIYMEFAKVNPDKAKMNVLIQEFIKAKMSGIFFTKNPITNSDAEMACQFGYMQGEKLVSGEESGIYAIIDKQTKKFKMQGDSSKLPFGVNPSSDLESSGIIDKALEIEQLFGFPQDIEFTVGQDETTYILQSRDITGLE
ncbi:MAG: hypothetical protein KJ697_01475 [Nanoarchaeota archaeon]|nr:hypothetical protein [Nanoarchaeota archaeon]